LTAYHQNFFLEKIGSSYQKAWLRDKHFVGYHKKGYPKQRPKKLLRTCKYRSQNTTAGKPPFHPRPGWIARPTSNNIQARPKQARPRTIPRGLGRGTDSPTRPRPRATRPRTSHRFSDSPEAPRYEASDEHPVTDLLEAGSAPAPSPPL